MKINNIRRQAGSANASLFLVCCSIFFLSSCSGSKQIGKQSSNILLNDSIISTGQIGISIYEPATNKYWYNHDAEKYFMPASNTKLFSLYAGMKYLGDSLIGLRY
jgi:D-alanyl-D-alanine carboxypeptidase/D-alanyl-D-alanine-endopeptidase (penicillin-binding protein 4)